MAKTRTAYVCNDCGSDHRKWQGQCQDCGAWNTLSEIRLGAAPSPAATSGARQGYAGASGGEVQTLATVQIEDLPRISSGSVSTPPPMPSPPASWQKVAEEEGRRVSRDAMGARHAL
ncbi:MAG: hypothetical protein ACPHN3_11010, partial [Spongiibacter sp.]